MKNLTKLLVPAFALAVGFTSCDKAPTTTTPTPNPQPQTPSAPTPVTPVVADNPSGVMVALRMSFNYSMPQIPMPISVNSDLGIASFYSSPGSSTLVDAGGVKVNSYDLKKADNHAYTITATTGLTPSSLDFNSGSVEWKVAGSSSVNSMSYTHTGSFPDFAGELPKEINRSATLEIELGSDVKNADSVYVVIIDKNGKTVMKSYGAKPAPAKATFSSSDLSALSAVTDNAAYVEVVPFTYKIQSNGGKQYVFIKEYAAVTAVNIK